MMQVGVDGCRQSVSRLLGDDE